MKLLTHEIFRLELGFTVHTNRYSLKLEIKEGSSWRKIIKIITD